MKMPSWSSAFCINMVKEIADRVLSSAGQWSPSSVPASHPPKQQQSLSVHIYQHIQPLHWERSLQKLTNSLALWQIFWSPDQFLSIQDLGLLAKFDFWMRQHLLAVTLVGSVHYGEVGTFACRSNHKVVNFGKLFLCQYSSNTWKIWHEACLTPQKSGNEKK